MFNTREAKTDCLYIQALKFPFSCENVTEYSTKVVSGKLTPMRQRQPTLHYLKQSISKPLFAYQQCQVLKTSLCQS